MGHVRSRYDESWQLQHPRDRWVANLRLSALAGRERKPRQIYGRYDKHVKSNEFRKPEPVLLCAVPGEYKSAVPDSSIPEWNHVVSRNEHVQFQNPIGRWRFDKQRNRYGEWNDCFQSRV